MKQTIVIIFILLLFCSTSNAGQISGNVVIQTRLPSETEWKLAENFSNAVVFIGGLTEDPLSDAKPAVNIQKDKAFVPNVMAIQQGQEVVFQNQDPINHNVFSLSKSKNFDLGLFKAPTVKSVEFDKPGLVKVFCNIHHQMIATFLVLKNRYFVITSDDGSYQIKDIPSGDYKVLVWVDGAKIQSKKVTVTETSQDAVDFTLNVVQQSQTHRNKFGKPYKKY